MSHEHHHQQQQHYSNGVNGHTQLSSASSSLSLSASNATQTVSSSKRPRDQDKDKDRDRDKAKKSKRPKPSSSSSHKNKLSSTTTTTTTKNQHANQQITQSFIPNIDATDNPKAPPKKKQSEFLTQIRYRNDLPAIPFEPKLQQYPSPADRLYRHVSASLDLMMPKDIMTEKMLGIPIDLINVHQYQQPRLLQEIHEDDLPLLQEYTADINKIDTSVRSKSKRGGATHGIGVSGFISKRGRGGIITNTVPWLKKTSLLSNDLYVTSSQVSDARSLRSQRPQARPTQPVQELTEQEEIEMIETTFAMAKLTPKHQTNKDLTPVQIIPILPDESLCSGTYHFRLVRFESSPLDEVARKMFPHAWEETNKTAAGSSSSSSSSSSATAAAAAADAHNDMLQEASVSTSKAILSTHSKNSFGLYVPLNNNNLPPLPSSVKLPSSMSHLDESNREKNKAHKKKSKQRDKNKNDDKNESDDEADDMNTDDINENNDNESFVTLSDQAQVSSRQLFEWTREYVLKPTPATLRSDNHFLILSSHVARYGIYEQRMNIRKRVKETDDVSCEHQPVTSRPASVVLNEFDRL